MVRRVPLARCGLVYELTDYGRAFEPIMLALGRWGFQAMGDPQEGDAVTPDALTMALRTSFRPDRAIDGDYELHVGDVALRAQVRGDALAVTQLAPPAPPVGGALPSGEAEGVIVAGPGIRRLIGGEISPAEARDQGVVDLRRGDPELLERFARTFRIDRLPSAPVDASTATPTLS